jgi:hypothetical protein
LNTLIQHSTPTRISLADLQQTAASFPLKVRQEPNWTTFNLATSIIGHFLGKEWVKANIPQQNAGSTDPVGFFQMDFSSPEKAEAKTARILDFAETLFNLQDVGGFDARINQMRTGDAEAACAEFDFGRFLYIHDVDFRFVVPSGQRGRDYDCAVTYTDGRSACADAKCRIENSDIRPAAIRHALETARKKNLPKDEPGIVFVKVPQTWLQFSDVRHGLVDVAAEFLRQTERIVLIALYCAVQFPVQGQQLTVMRHLQEEIENPKHRFDMTKSWRLFKGFQVPAKWNGMPPKWQRIFSRGSDDPAYQIQSTPARINIT